MAYRVTLRFQYPAWDEVNGLDFEVDASTKADAIRQARRIAFDHTFAARKGRTTFTAVPLE